MSTEKEMAYKTLSHTSDLANPVMSFKTVNVNIINMVKMEHASYTSSSAGKQIFQKAFSTVTDQTNLKHYGQHET